jgi:hypothetical protein
MLAWMSTDTTFPRLLQIARTTAHEHEPVCSLRAAVHTYSVLAVQMGGRVQEHHRGKLTIESGDVHLSLTRNAHPILASNRRRVGACAVLDARARGSGRATVRVRSSALRHARGTRPAREPAETGRLLTLVLIEVARVETTLSETFYDERQQVAAVVNPFGWDTPRQQPEWSVGT